MDVIKIRTADRNQRIHIISETLKKAFAAGLPVDKDKMILESCSNLSISRRTAIEYLNIALVQFNTQEEKVDGKVVIIKIL